MNKEMIPVKFIKEKIEECYYIAERAIPKVQQDYLDTAKHLKSLIWNWETFGNSWEKENSVKISEGNYDSDEEYEEQMRCLDEN